MTDLVQHSTADPTEAQAAAAHTAELEVKAIIHRMRSAWADLAERLYHFSERRHWRALGYRSFEQWLASPEIDLSRREVFYLIEAWRELVVERGVEPKRLERVQVSKVRDVLPAVRRGVVTPDEALSDAETLSREDLREHYAHVGRPGSESPSERPLDATTEPAFTVCDACGSRIRVRGAVA
jgi:hypothetical protein